MRGKDTGITVTQEDPNSKEAARLLRELSTELAAITGSGGETSFDIDDMTSPRAVFAIARNEMGEAVGCGALRPIDGTVAEVKRVYARQKGRGIGSAILAYLEERAAALGYARLVLETRKVNEKAVAFYLARGYEVIENYGKYAGREDAVCFGKSLAVV